MADYRVYIGSERRTLSQLLGEGFEAVVLLDSKSGRAVKLYTKKIPGYDRIMAIRERKISRLLSKNLPDWIYGPKDIVYDDRGKFVGMTMDKMPDEAVSLEELVSRKLQRRLGFNAKTMLEFFIRVFGQLRVLNQEHGIVVGDVNSKNLEWWRKLSLALFCDVDSYQIDSQEPCLTGTKEYLPPRLYNEQVFEGKTLFTPQDDEWSLAVHCFEKSLLIHPFHRGGHAIESMPDRVLAGISVFDRSAVQYPGIARPLETFSDRLLHVFYTMFVSQKRTDGVFNVKYLEDEVGKMMLCNDCSEYYHSSRIKCPTCHPIHFVPVSQAPITLVFRISELMKNLGVVLSVGTTGDGFWYVTAKHKINGRITVHELDLTKNSSAKERATIPITHYDGMEVRVGRSVVVVEPTGNNSTVTLFDPKTGMFRSKSVTGSYLKKVVMASVSTAWVLAKEKIYQEHTRLGQVFFEEVIPATSNTWFDVARDNAGEDVLVGFHHILQTHQWFVHHRGKTYGADITRLDASSEVQMDASVYVSDSILVIRRTVKSVKSIGETRFHIDVLSLDGKLVLHQELTNKDFLNRTTGRAYHNFVAFHPTDEGLVRHDLRTGETKVYPETVGLVNSDDDLIRVDNWKMLAYSEKRVVFLDASPL